MKIVSLAQARSKFSEYVNISQNELVVVTKNGQPAAVIMAISNQDDLESLALVANPRFRKLLENAAERVASHKYTTMSEMKQSLGL